MKKKRKWGLIGMLVGMGVAGLVSVYIWCFYTCDDCISVTGEYIILTAFGLPTTLLWSLLEIHTDWIDTTLMSNVSLTVSFMINWAVIGWICGRVVFLVREKRRRKGERDVDDKHEEER